MQVNERVCDMEADGVIDMLNDMRIEDGWCEPLPGKHAMIKQLIPVVEHYLGDPEWTSKARVRLEKMLVDLLAMQKDKYVDALLYSTTIKQIQNGTFFSEGNQIALPKMRTILREYLEEMRTRPLSPMERLKCSAVVDADKEFVRLLQMDPNDGMNELYAAFSKLSVAASSSEPGNASRKPKRKH